MQSVEVRFMVFFAAFITCVSKVWFFTYNPYFKVVGLDVTYYGVVFFLLNIVAWLSSRYAYKVELYIGEGNCILGMILCVGAPLIIMGLIPIEICAYLVLVQNVVRGFMKPFIGDYLHRHIATEIRATTMSIESSFANMLSIIALASFGFLTSQVSLPQSLVILGSITLVLGVFSYILYKRKVE